MHRLDKLTSGLLLISKTAEMAVNFHHQLKDKKVEKTYLARVHGKLVTDDEENKELTINKPIYCVSIKDGKFDVCDETEKGVKNGKDATTIIKSIWYDEKSNTSLLECKPITGKTHQIRVHLKSIGHSIVNDTSYGGKFIGNFLIKYMSKKENNDEEKIVKKIKLDEKGKEKQILVKGETNEEVKEFEKLDKDTEALVEKDINTHAFEIWLHSFKYKFSGTLYSTKMPYWASYKNIEF